MRSRPVAIAIYKEKVHRLAQLHQVGVVGIDLEPLAAVAKTTFDIFAPHLTFDYMQNANIFRASRWVHPHRCLLLARPPRQLLRIVVGSPTAAEKVGDRSDCRQANNSRRGLPHVRIEVFMRKGGMPAAAFGKQSCASKLGDTTHKTVST